MVEKLFTGVNMDKRDARKWWRKQAEKDLYKTFILWIKIRRIFGKKRRKIW